MVLVVFEPLAVFVVYCMRISMKRGGLRGRLKGGDCAADSDDDSWGLLMLTCGH